MTKPGQSVCKHSNPDPLLCGACRLEQAVSQPHLTLETVDAQFCSDWLKDEIKRLFREIEELKLELLDAKVRFEDNE